MASLTKTQTELLEKILSGSGLHPASEDALQFRASNEDALDDLDELEQLGILKRANNKYSLSILGLVDLRAKNVDADSLLHLSAHLFDVLRRLYKRTPGQNIGIDELAKAAEFPKGRVQRGLSYLIQAPIWTTHAGMPDSIAAITPSENILRYKDFEEVIRALRDQQRKGGNQVGFREKQQKFRVLDSPALLPYDLTKSCGIFGRAVLYLDLDDFKKINSKLTEVVVDRLILPPTHELLAKCVDGLGFAYAEGGDEFTILLPNSSEKMALEFAQAVRTQISALRFDDLGREIHLTVSIGVAHGALGGDGQGLRERANVAKNGAKGNGKNCISVWASPRRPIA